MTGGPRNPGPTGYSNENYMTYAKRRNRQARQRKLNRSLWNYEKDANAGGSNRRTLVHYHGLGQRPTMKAGQFKKWLSRVK